MLLRDYFNSFTLFTKDKLPRNQIGSSGVQDKKENKKFTVVCSRSPQNLEFGHFTLLFCKRRERNVPKRKTHVQRDCFFLINPFVLWRCRCRRRRVFARPILATFRSENECEIENKYVFQISNQPRPQNC